jgi:hypothetical protein
MSTAQRLEALSDLHQDLIDDLATISRNLPAVDELVSSKLLTNIYRLYLKWTQEDLEEDEEPIHQDLGCELLGFYMDRFFELVRNDILVNLRYAAEEGVTDEDFPAFLKRHRGLEASAEKYRAETEDSLPSHTH